LKRGARAVFQFYPESAQQVEMITSCAMRCGFGGGVVVDFPHSTRAKKTYLVIHTGFQGNSSAASTTVSADSVATGGVIGDRHERIATVNRGKTHGRGVKKSINKTKAWIMNKKDRQRRQGKEIKADSKYTGRKRKDRF
jgi:18S rRNA (guanine1575-N7)-methyltransferase